MKFFIKLMVVVFVCIGLGWGIYYMGTNLASDQLVGTLSSELEASGEMEAIKLEIEEDPELLAIIEDAAQADQTKLPFTTKEEATRVVIKKVGVSELMKIQEQVQSGAMTKEEVISRLEETLTEEEILALKVIAYKELQNR
ncbi:hypothetical protein M1D60_00520 [Bacillus sp. AK128]